MVGVLLVDSLVGSLLLLDQLVVAAVFRVDVVPKDFAVVESLSKLLLLAVVPELEISYISLYTLDCVNEVRVHVFEEGAFFAFAEGEAGRHAVDDPRARLNDSALHHRQVGVHLVNRFSKFFVGRNVAPKVLLSDAHKFVES